MNFEPLRLLWVNWNIGLLDQWYPEAAVDGMKGAEILIYPTAIGWKVQIQMIESQMSMLEYFSKRAHAVGQWPSGDF